MAYLPMILYLFIVATFTIHNVTGLCTSGSSSLQNVCTEKILSKKGDIKFVVLAQIQESKRSKKCDEVSIAGFQTAVAIQWIVERLNGFGDTNQSFIPGVTLGYDIYDDCGLSSRATNGLLDLIPESKPPDLLQCTKNCTDAPLTGVIAVTSLEATETASELSPSNLPFISALATSPRLESRNNVLFTSGSLQTEINAILRLLIQLQWHYIGIVYTDDALGVALKNEYEHQSKNFHVCSAYSRQIPITQEEEPELMETVKDIVSVFAAEMSEKADAKFGVVYLGGKYGAEIILNVIKDKTSTAYNLEWIMSSIVGTSMDIVNLLEDIRLKNNIVFSLTFSPFNIYFSELEIFHDNLIHDNNSLDYSPWIRKYIEKIKSSTYNQENVHSTISAVISLTAALKQIHQNKCKMIPGVCQQMQTSIENGDIQSYMTTYDINLSTQTKQFPAELQTLNTTMNFRHSRRLQVDNTPELILKLYVETKPFFYQVGNYTEGNLSLTDDTQLVDSKSLCKSKCEICLEKEDLSFVYIPGNFLILGLFSVSGSNDDSDGVETAQRYTCGGYREGTHSVVNVLSFIEAIKSLNDQSDVQFGGIAFDDCYNPLNISFLLADLFSGKRILRDRNSGDVIDMSNVVAVVGALSSKVTQVIADQMTTLKIPMLSYGASAASLDDRIRYPFFLRTVPSDTLQVDGLIDLLVYFNFTHIGAVYYNDAYGLSGVQEFQKKAPGRGICVESPENLTEGFRRGDLEKLVKNLRRNLVDVVLFYGIDTAAKDLLQILSESTDGRTFTFIATEAWGTNPQLISGNLGNQAKGSLVFITDTSFHLDSKFLEYLKTITPETNTGNPWMTDFWQDTFQCSFPESYNKKNMKSCDRKQRLSTEQAKAIYDDQRVVHTVHAVYAIREGIMGVINEVCGGYKVCNSMRSVQNAKLLTKYIRNSVMTAENGERFSPFKEDGNGYMGFSIYNIQRKLDNTFHYVLVGSYSEEQKLKLQTTNVTFYDRFGYPAKSIEAKCSYKFQKCSSVCPQTTVPTTITDVTSSVTTPPTNDSSFESSIMPIILGVVIGILVIIVVLLVVLMLRQQKTKSLIKERSTASIASHHVSSLNIYDEPRSNDGVLQLPGRINRNFEPSSSSGVANSSTSSSALQKDPIQYTHIKGVASGDIHSRFSNQSTPSLSRHISSSVHSLTSGASQTHSLHGTSLQASNEKSNSMNRRHSADDILSDSNSLTYMTAKDFDMQDEDLSEVDYLQMSGNNPSIANARDSKQNLEPIRPKQKPIRRKGVNSNDIEMMPIPKPSTTEHQVQRPNTLPGISSQNAPDGRGNQIAFSNAIPHPSVQNQDLYLNPVTGHMQSPIVNGFITPDHEIKFLDPTYQMQYPNGQMMIVQSPNMQEQEQRMHPQQTQQPTMVVYPNAYLPYTANYQFSSPNTQQYYQGEMHQDVPFQNQDVPFQNQRVSPGLSPNSRNLQNTKHVLSMNDTPKQIRQVPSKQLQSPVFTTGTGYLIPHEYDTQAQRLSHGQSNQPNVQNLVRFRDLSNLNPLENTINNQMSPKVVSTPDYVNAQHEESNTLRLPLKSVPDVLMHSSLDKEEEVII